MTPQEHLKNELEKCSQYSLSGNEKNFIKDKGLREFLFQQITRKKFRRWKLPDKAKETIETAFNYCLKQGEPLTFRFRFGGYKLWRLESSPEVDWAEFFTLVHYSRYLAPIISAYKPGVKMLFMSDDVFVERLNNVSKENTEAYYRSFQELLDEFRKYFPDNFDIDMIRHSSLYKSPEALEEEFRNKENEIKDSWKDSKTFEQMKSELITSELNIQWDGVKDLSNLSDEEKQQKIERSVFYHDVLVQLPTIRAFTGKNPGIISVFTTPFPTVISIGTTKTSVAKFWVGTGILEKRDGKYFDRILTPQQVKAMKDTKYEEVNINLINLKNFRSIRVYNDALDFVHKS